MKQVFYLTDYKEFGCVDSKDKLAILINRCINKYYLDRAFGGINAISVHSVYYSYLDLDLKEFILGEIDYSSLDVVS